MQLVAGRGLVGDHQRDLERQALRARGRRRRARPAGPWRCGSARSGRAAASRSCWAGWVETMISSGRCSATASIVAENGSASPTSPVASMPSSCERREREVDAHLRRFAHRLVVDHQAGGRVALRHHQAEADRPRRRGRARRRAACAPPSVRLATHEDLPHWRPPSSARRPQRRRCAAVARGRGEDAVDCARARRTRTGRRRRSASGRS